MSDGLGPEKEPTTPVAKTDALTPSTGPASDSGEDDGIPGNPVGQLQVRKPSFRQNQGRYFSLRKSRRRPLTSHPPQQIFF